MKSWKLDQSGPGEKKNCTGECKSCDILSGPRQNILHPCARPAPVTNNLNNSIPPIDLSIFANWLALRQRLRSSIPKPRNTASLRLSLHRQHLDIMPSTVGLAGRAPALLRHGRRVPIPTSASARTFTLGGLNAFAQAQTQIRNQRYTQKRSFTRTAIRASTAAAQPAPDAKAYLDSGVIKPHEHVDVKKVLVIGSGGLAIGQAGEFDYSGWCPLTSRPRMR